MNSSGVRILFLALLCHLTTAAQEFSFPQRPLTGEKWIGPVSGSVTYSLDSDLHIASRQVNARPSVAYSYDPDKLLIGVGQLTIARHPQNGLITGKTLWNITESWAHNEFGELTNCIVTSGPVSLYALFVTRDALGRIVSATERIAGTTNNYVYTYDPGDRLSSVTLNGSVTARYTYDSNDNRLTVEDVRGSHSATFDDQDRLVSLGGATYTWTPNGDLATRDVAGQLTRFEYDVFGNLRLVHLPGGSAISYVVDGRNRRVGKKLNGSLAQGFLYEGSLRPVAELDGTGNVITEFVYGARENAPEYLIKDGQTYRIICDHVGSIRLIVNTSTGGIAQRLDYDPFGRVLTDTAPSFQPFGFAGGLYDRDTKLLRFGARDYDPDTGRWTAKDPILFAAGQPNLYAYARNDPANFIDPTGLEEFSPGPTPQHPAVRKLNELKKKIDKLPFKPGGLPDPCGDFNAKQAADKGMAPPTGPGGLNFGFSATFTF